MEQRDFWAALLHLMGENGREAPVDFSQAFAARWSRTAMGGHMEAISQVDLQDSDDLLGIDRARELLDRNTRQFVQGLPANDALLWGGRGTGKSSLVKAMLARYRGQGLRLVEVDQAGILDLPGILAALKNADPEARYRFLLFCDDLSFGADDPAYKPLKSLLDGGVEARPGNVLLYATSNRRHLMPRHFADNEEYRRHGEEIVPGETAEEKISLSERFGLWLGFYPFDQDTYLRICQVHLDRLGVTTQGEAAWREEALRWALTRGSRSGRVARQFARDFAGRLGLGGEE